MVMDTLKFAPNDPGQDAPISKGACVPWWVWVLLLLHGITVALVGWEQRSIRAELDDNAKLIRQLQERRAVKEMMELRSK